MGKAIQHTRTTRMLPINLDRKLFAGLLWYWLPVLAYAGTITYLSSLSEPIAHFQDIAKSFVSVPVDSFTRINDKIYHITVYALLGILTHRAIQFTWGLKLETKVDAITVVAVMLFGCTDEFHQWFTPLRYVDGWDILADAVGGLLGVMFWKCSNTVPVFTFLEEYLPLKLQARRSLTTSKF